MTTIESAPQLTKEEAIATVGGILTEVSLMGANDSEIPELMQIMKDLEDGKGDIAAHVERARQIQGSKMQYH